MWNVLCGEGAVLYSDQCGVYTSLQHVIKHYRAIFQKAKKLVYLSLVKLEEG